MSDTFFTIELILLDVAKQLSSGNISGANREVQDALEILMKERAAHKEEEERFFERMETNQGYLEALESGALG